MEWGQVGRGMKERCDLGVVFHLVRSMGRKDTNSYSICNLVCSWFITSS